MSRLQTSPAARKPLYKPWLAAMPLVGLKSSGGIDLKVRLPTVSQASISMYKKYRCSRATSAMRIWLRMDIGSEGRENMDEMVGKRSLNPCSRVNVDKYRTSV